MRQVIPTLGARSSPPHNRSASVSGPAYSPKGSSGRHSTSPRCDTYRRPSSSICTSTTCAIVDSEPIIGRRNMRAERNINAQRNRQMELELGELVMHEKVIPCFEYRGAVREGDFCRFLPSLGDRAAARRRSHLKMRSLSSLALCPRRPQCFGSICGAFFPRLISAFSAPLPPCSIDSDFNPCSDAYPSLSLAVVASL